jgi:aldehyde:ferredoxin oxidoreductase
VQIPRRFAEVVTWKGPLDGQYLSNLKSEYSRRIRSLAAEAEQDRGKKTQKQKKGDST